MGTDCWSTVDEDVERSRYQASRDMPRRPGHRAKHFAKTAAGRGTGCCGCHQGQRRTARHDHGSRTDERAGNQARHHPALRRGMCNRVAEPCSSKQRAHACSPAQRGLSTTPTSAAWTASMVGRLAMPFTAATSPSRACSGSLACGSVVQSVKCRPSGLRHAC